MIRALDEAAAKLESSERKRSEPIAIIGASCRFPGEARDLASYWRLLALGIDATGDMPLDRWDIDALYDPNPDNPGKLCTRRGAFLSEIDRFDAEHFNISPREATTLDPQHRLLLEIAHEALDGAGQLDDRLADNLTGVFIGVTNNDYAHLLREHKSHRPLDAYFITGNAPNGAAGRLSYQLGLRGPSMVVDTACSSSLTSVQLACQSLRQQECNLALAGGVNLLVMPDTYAALSRARLLAADGRCKTFDAAADGYGRGEGGGLVVLKRLSDAQRDGDTIIATIRGGAINHDGPSSGFTVPNGAAQRTLLQQALTASRLTPGEVDYIEAHGTGTSLGDPIEVNALVDVYGESRTTENPLLIGSVKTNLGHLESGAGIAGLIKVALSLWHRQLPRHLHFKNPSPRIAWAEIPVKVTTDHQDWPNPGRLRRAGVSSFGVSGTNAHLILEESDPAERGTLPAPQKQFRGRQRYWAFERPQYAKARDWLYQIDWEPRAPRERERSPVAFDPTAAGLKASSWADGAATTYAESAYAAVLPALEQLATTYAAAAVQALGDGDRVQPAHARLWQRLKNLATQATVDTPPEVQSRQLIRTQPEARIEITLLQRCGESLVDVLTGQTDPLTLLFPGDGTDTAAELYGGTPVARALNDLIGQWIDGAVPTHQPLRVLEIGAGTGATTTTVWAALAGREIDYTFSDISPLFLQQAASRFADRPGMSFRSLDIEQDPLTQGFAVGEFDLIIGSNVIHATRDLATALQHTRQLLARGGQLALVELTAPLAFLDIVFGLTDGWWRFTDTSLRSEHPLLDRPAWTQLLAQHGFSDAQAHGLPESAGAIFCQQALLTGTAAASVLPPPDLRGRWLFIGQVSSALRAELDATTATVTITTVDEIARVIVPDAWDGVVYLPTTAESATDDPPLRDALDLAHALIDAPAPWWIVTQGAIAVRSGDTVPQLASAGLWGFARTVAQEHPELAVRCLDLDPNAPAEVAASQMLNALRQSDRENQIAWRDSQQFVARLVPQDSPGIAEEFTVTSEGTFLIVGGTGGLGLSLAAWLSERGARHLVLAARRAIDASTAAAIERLKVTGVSVRQVQLDVVDAVAVKQLVGALANEAAPLRGIIHAAGVLDDGGLKHLNWTRFEHVLAPKVAGAWNLHESSRELPLDLFVVFSSSTALLGTPGQANHAAANAWLDALSSHRQAFGLPGVSINWGPWAEIGAAARQSVAANARRHGMGTISAVKGWHLCGEILQRPTAQVAVLPMTWTETPASLVQAPFFDRVRAAAKATVAPADRPTPVPTVDWTALVPVKRTRLLAELIHEEIATVLGLDAGAKLSLTKGFFALGMDSLTAVELRNRLQNRIGLKLPSTIVFDHSSIEALSRKLTDMFETPKATPEPALTDAPSDQITSLSGPELSALLDDELKDI
ncbi:MAG: SDR family NAD(P)-dependent oxidoreductase [bacterium]